jgi:hypothetical protein
MPVFTTLVSDVNTPVAGATPQGKPPAQDVKIHKCEYCDLTFNTTKGMNIHKGRMHKDVAPTPVDGPVTAPKPPEEIHSQQVSLRAAMNTPTKLPVYVPGTTYSRGQYSCPGNAPPPPPCEKCGNPTYWSCSRVRQDMGWLHEFFCLCLTRKCINTPPIS